MRIRLIYYLLFLGFVCVVQTKNTFSQQPYPPEVEAVLKKAGQNRAELEKALTYYGAQKDPLKLKAMEFLITNMSIHHSANYYWADSAGSRIAFNELDYPDFTTAVQAFEELKKKHPEIKPKPFTYQDTDSIKAAFLITNVEQAFSVWKDNPRAKQLRFEDFCEYILPYRVSVEPLQDWRSVYSDKYKWVAEKASVQNIDKMLLDVAEDFDNNFTTVLTARKEPLPRLGALQILHRKEGACEDVAALEVFTLRSQGIPAALNIVPYWATSSGSHYFNTVFDSVMNPISFDVGRRRDPVNSKLHREPAKVLQVSYAAQPGTLAGFKPSESIPPGFMRTVNYTDVTHQFWETKDVEVPLYALKSKPADIVYACVFNYGGWKPSWWGKVNGNNTTFTNMSKGAVYLPMYYLNGKLRPAGYPVASGYHNRQVLKPDTLQKRTVSIQQQESYLIFRPGKKYRLYYWDNNWKLLGEKITTESSTELLFENAPANALFLLIPEYSQRKERPFIVTAEGQRVWF